MEKNEFYSKYANTPIEKRFSILSNAYNNPLLGMTLNAVYDEISFIDDKLRSDEIRRDELLREVEPFLIP